MGLSIDEWGKSCDWSMTEMRRRSNAIWIYRLAVMNSSRDVKWSGVSSATRLPTSQLSSITQHFGTWTVHARLAWFGRLFLWSHNDIITSTFYRTRVTRKIATRSFWRCNNWDETRYTDLFSGVAMHPEKLQSIPERWQIDECEYNVSSTNHRQ